MIQRAIFDYPVQMNPAAWLAAARDVPGKHSAGAYSSAQRHERLLGKRVLVVEDEALLALDLQYAFEDAGAEVLGPALSLMQALETVAHAAAIDLAVLDVDLAGEDVYPIAEILLQRGVPFVFHTGHGSRSELTQLFPGTITLMKPTLPETLIDHLLRLSR
jgi:CheY-like chemotaxis protein